MIEPPSIDAYLDASKPVGAAGQAANTRFRTAVRDYLAAVRAHLEALHREGDSGQRVNEANSDLVDRLVRRLFERAEAEYDGAHGDLRDRLCVVAVGGYARREMSIHSDVDLLLLHRGELTPDAAWIAGRMQVGLWDSGLEVGCATRTIEDTIALALDDVTVRTAVLDARFLAGDESSFLGLREAIRAELMGVPEQFIAEQLEILRERHAAFGDSLYLLQPNLKEGAGGLRDYHVAYWAMRAVEPSTRSRDDLLQFGLLSEPEMQEFRAALQFLWWVRNELHLVSRRRNDQMSFELQEHIAESFGYDDGADGDGIELPVERFMRDYYRHARAVRNFSEIVIEQCQTRARKPRAQRKSNAVADGFRIVDGHLEIPDGAHLRERPLRLLTAFAIAQDHDVELSRTARRLVRDHLTLVDATYQRDPKVTAMLDRILRAKHRVMRSLMAMNEIGLLGRVIPEWEHIVCRWQHVIYHTYTVDVHSIFLVEALRRLWRGKYERELPAMTVLIREVDDLPVLFLGCLLHDIGKGFGQNHSELGADRARTCLTRLQFPPKRMERVEFLVRYHLRMSHLAQRRDLSDPMMILDFARTCGDRENLRNLYLLTFADTRASSKSAWNSWKGELLRELFERTSDLLESGADDPGRAIELIEKRAASRRKAARAVLSRSGVEAAEIEAYFESVPRRYFISHTPQQIARHARVVLAFTGERLMTTAVRDIRRSFSEFILCTKDVHGLYSNVAGALTASGINILGSHVYTMRSGLALEVYRLTIPMGGPEERKQTWSDFEARLRAILGGETTAAELLSRRRYPVGVTRTPSRTPPAVEVSNSESDFYTIADVATNDRLGLLYDLTRTIAEHGFEIYISKAATILDQVTDTFYIKDRGGQKIRDAEQLERLRRDLLRAAQLAADETRG